jgi:hypothetical protein
MAAAKNKRLMLKMLSLFSVVRGYNILVLVIAQYLTSAFILAPELPLRAVIFDDYLFFLILSSATVIASGYIINNFYDSEKGPHQPTPENYAGQVYKSAHQTFSLFYS